MSDSAEFLMSGTAFGLEMRLPNRFGQAANYRESMGRLRRTQRLLGVEPVRAVANACERMGGGIMSVVAVLLSLLRAMNGAPEKRGHNPHDSQITVRPVAPKQIRIWRAS